MPEQWSMLDLAEGFHLAHAVMALHERGILASLTATATAEEVAAAHGLDPGMLAAVLEYVCARTDLVARTAEGYVATERCTTEALAMLDQYVGAYGPCSANLSALLVRPGPGGAPGPVPGALVDRDKHARAYARLPGPGIKILPELLRRLELGHVLDIGCGPAALLVDLAVRDPVFMGWGVDASPAMCTAARERIASAGVGDRVTVLEGDARALATALPRAIRDRVQTITAASLANEFFFPDTAPAIAWLRDLRALFPERILVIADYYGRLGQSEQPLPRTAGLHDYVQVISGQGVPPPDLAAWQEIYEAAGCSLAHVIEDPSSTCFIHLLRL